MFKPLENFQSNRNPKEIILRALKESEQYKITPEDKNEYGELLAYPNGPKSNLENELHWKMVRTEAFKEWFGDWQNKPDEASRVIDNNGEPLIVYHSSHDSFDEFDPQKSQYFLTLGKGSYFTPDPSLSEIYGDKRYTCFLNIKNNIYKQKERSALQNGLRNVYYSLIRPKESGFIEPHDESEIPERKLFGEVSQVCVLHKEDIAIIPSDIEHPMEKYREKIDGHFRENGSSPNL